MSLRIEKINSELRRQIMDIIQKEIDDPTLGLLSITRVETTPDLQESKVYFSLLDDTKYARAKEVLDIMNAFIRVNLGKKIRIKILPQLKFIPDNSIKYSIDIFKKIEELEEESRNKKKKT
jgi:ribosome-binding factor A